jgi:TATA-binding protein-associated factor Taf7
MLVMGRGELIGSLSFLSKDLSRSSYRCGKYHSTIKAMTAHKKKCDGTEADDDEEDDEDEEESNEDDDDEENYVEMDFIGR